MMRGCTQLRAACSLKIMNRVLLEIAAFVFVAVLILTGAPLAMLKIGQQPELEGISTIRSRVLTGRRLTIKRGLAAGKWFLVSNNGNTVSLDSDPAIQCSTIKLQNYVH